MENSALGRGNGKDPLPFSNWLHHANGPWHPDSVDGGIGFAEGTPAVRCEIHNRNKKKTQAPIFGNGNNEGSLSCQKQKSKQ